jgi:transposase InsO family protein
MNLLVSQDNTICITRLCQLYQLSRQFYYRERKQEVKDHQKALAVKEFIQTIRKDLPSLGGKKCYVFLKDMFERAEIKLGRDKFLDIYRKYGFKLYRKPKYVRTTNSKHHFYKHKNLIQDFQITAPNQVIGSDITYIRLREGRYLYLFLVMDLYSRKITGYDLSRSLGVEGGIRAMKMALSNGATYQIHHSDRGIQYCSNEYTKLLESKGILISMSEKGNPYENAKVERLNGIIKYEFGLAEVLGGEKLARKMLEQAVKNYNTLRPHLSLGYKTPEQVHSGL